MPGVFASVSNIYRVGNVLNIVLKLSLNIAILARKEIDTANWNCSRIQKIHRSFLIGDVGLSALLGLNGKH